MVTRATQIDKYIKSKAKSLPCLDIMHPHAIVIVEIHVSEKCFGGILKQRHDPNLKN